MPDPSRAPQLLKLGRIVLSATVGELRWNPPRWPRVIAAATRRGGGAIRRHPLVALGAFSVLLSLTLLCGKAVVWYRSRPRPLELTVEVAGPAPTPVVKRARPFPLVLRFSGSAAPIEAIGKPVLRGVTLSPSHPGLWQWRSDRELRFTPSEEWPVGRELVVRLEPGAHTDSVRLERYRMGFRTPRFEVTLEGASFHEDPRDPAQKKVVATLRCSHPVDPASLVRRLRLELGARLVAASVGYDELRGRAFVHSAPLQVPEQDLTLRLSLAAGVRAARGGPGSERPIEARVQVPGRDSLRIKSARVAVVYDADGRPSHRLVIETNQTLASAELGRALTAHLLPLHHPLRPVEKDPYRWEDPSLIGPEILRLGQLVAFSTVAGPSSGTLHSFRASRPLPVGRALYAVVRRGLISVGGYRLAASQDALSAIPAFPPLLKFVHSGAVLGLRGDKSVAVVARDLPGVRLQIGRVLPGQIHHLVAANHGELASPQLRGLSDESLSEIFRELRTLPARAPGESQHLMIDLGRYLEAGGGQRRGLFLLRAEGFDPARRETTHPEVDDRRLILITDLGLLVKDSADGSHDLFVISLANGSPVAGASIELLGRNGRPISRAVSDRQGHARIPALPRPTGEDAREDDRTPTLYLVRRGADLSFLPYGRSDRYLDSSRFDVGGTRQRSDPRGLSAFLFSDRGIYRPGDEARFGAIVKLQDWSTSSLSGLPLQLSVIDPRGRELRRETLRLGRDGFEELRHRFSRSARAGHYHLNLHLSKDGKPERLLGHTSVEVREFEPDRMRIKLALSAAEPLGWLAPRQLAIQVSLVNLFGTPAAGRSVRARMVLYPRAPSVPLFAGHSFHDRTQHAKLRPHREELPPTRTDGRGYAVLPLRLERFGAASYSLEVEVEGFEAEGGRSVGASIVAAISPLPFLVGFRADGPLETIPRGSGRSVELRAVGPRGTAVAARGLRLELRKKVYRSVLTRQSDGTYRYESVASELPRSTRSLEIPEAGVTERLPTEESGEYLLLLRDSAGELNRIAFSVAGEANVQRSLERNAELELKLDRDDVAPGDELRVRVKAPYRAGSGLLTIERERVHAFRWFKTQKAESVLTLRVPPELEGNGYLTVTLLRDPSSSEVFASPLSHAIVNFTVRRERRAVKVELETAAGVRAGEPLAIRYRTDRPARVLIFAVDEGILRVAHYTPPNPLEHFLRKRALEVRTAQILDLILPEARKLIQKDAAPGGGDDPLGGLSATNRNPFARRHRPALAFWSGILESSTTARELRIPIPDEFNGMLRVMAVAVAPEAVGAADRRTRVRADFVITPHAPGFVAPGDEFEIGVTVANTPAAAASPAPRRRGSARVVLELGATSQLEPLGPSRVALEIPELEERSANFRVRARDQLGPATLRLVASSGRRRSKLSLEVSVRPASPYLTTILAGAVSGGGRGQVSVNPHRLYLEGRVLRAGVSSLPLALADGLRADLDRFPHGCTEQLVSKAVPALVLADRVEWGGSAAEAERAFARVLSTLRERQNEEGAFGLWAANPHTSPFATVYALHLLLEARERGHAVPKDLLWRGLSYLRGLGGAVGGGSIQDQRLRAYAIYVLTRAEHVSGAQATALHRRLRQRTDKLWRSDIAAAYLAASFRLLQEDELAEELIRGVRFGAVSAPDVEHYHDCLVHDAQLLYLVDRHFPTRAKQVGAEGVAALARAVGHGRQSTLSSALAILALDAHARTLHDRGTRHGASELLAGGARPLSLAGKLFARGPFAPEARALRFDAGTGGAFYSVVEAGYERELPRTPLKLGLEIHRELLDDHGRPVGGRVKLGQTLTARVRLRALGRGVQTGIAIIDLLPGGFDPLFPPGADSPLLPDSSFRPESTDGEEDRLFFYGQARPEVRELRYRVRPTVAGRFRVPAIKAESFYDRSLLARGVGGEIVVER